MPPSQTQATRTEEDAPPPVDETELGDLALVRLLDAARVRGSEASRWWGREDIPGVDNEDERPL